MTDEIHLQRMFFLAYLSLYFEMLRIDNVSIDYRKFGRRHPLPPKKNNNFILYRTGLISLGKRLSWLEIETGLKAISILGIIVCRLVLKRKR